MRSIAASIRLLACVLGLVLLAGACAATTRTAQESVVVQSIDADDDAVAEVDAVAFVPTAAFVAQAAEDSAAVETFRFEAFTEIDTSLLVLGSRTEPAMVGEVTADMSRVSVDAAPLLGPLAGLLSDADADDLTMTVITDDTTIYVNAPLLGLLAETEMADLAESSPLLDQITTGWGSVDATALGAQDPIAMAGLSFGADAEEALALLESVASVQDGGSSDVRGTPTQIARAQVALADVLDRTGWAVDDLDLSDGDAAKLESVLVDVDVHVDADNRIRRIEFALDQSDLALDESSSGMDVALWQRIDLYDFGSDVEIEAPNDAVDVTQDLVALLEDFG